MPVNQPLVTVFTLIYNTNPRFVIEAIESIRANNYPNIQHIIIDDCSPNPEPKRVVKEWIDREKYPCEFYEHEVNYGVCKTLNHVLELAKGKYIFGCSDDISTSNRIQSQINLFYNAKKNVAIVFSDMTVINGEGRIENHSYLDYAKILKSEIDLFDQLSVSDKIRYLLIDKNIIMAPSVMYKTESLRSVGGYDEKLYFEDLEMNIKLIKNSYQIEFDAEKNVSYRVHSASLSNSQNSKYYLSHLLLYKKYLGLNKELDSQLIGKIKNLTLRLSSLGERGRYYWFSYLVIKEFEISYVKNFILQELSNFKKRFINL